MKKQTWAYLFSRIVVNVIVIVVSVILASIILNWFWDKAFLMRRAMVCDRPLEIHTDKGNITITDNRPVYICEY